MATRFGWMVKRSGWLALTRRNCIKPAANAQGREWQCGRAAKARLVELVSRGVDYGRDRYGRTLAVCSASNVADLGEVLVREGYAVNFVIDYGGYPAAEREAQSNRSGLWQGDFERPKDWRRRHPRTGDRVTVR